MGNFYNTTFAIESMSVEQLDRIAVEQAGNCGGIGYGYACAGEVGKLAGGWSAMWTNRQGMGNHGDLILVPTDKRTRALAREGKVRAFMSAGLTREEAVRLQRVKARYKFELVGMLRNILDDKGKVAAICAHPGTYGPGSGRTKWWEAWGYPMWPEGMGLSAPREVELVTMVRAIVGTV